MRLPVAAAGSVPLLALAFFACGDDPVAPEPEVVLTATVTRLAPLEVAEGPFVTITCPVSLSATATGTGTALWADAVVRWYAGPDRATPVDSQVIPAAEVRALWDLSTVPAGSTAATDLRVSASVPFGLAIEFGYTSSDGSNRRTTTVRFTCGPEIPASAAPPTVDAVTVHDPGGAVGPGSEIMVDFAASSAIGLWQTAVVVTGPCDIVEILNDKLARAVTHSVRVRFPLSCVLDAPIVVSVFALDAALQEVVNVVETGWVSGDGIPPVIRNNDPFDRSGLYFVGDTVPAVITASDNVGLSALVWETLPSGTRDSMVLSSDSIRSWFAIPVVASWVGDTTLRIWAQDAAGLASDTIVLLAGPTRFAPTIAPPTMATEVTGTPVTMSLDDRRGRIYLLQSGPDVVLSLDLATLTTVGSIPLPAGGGADLDLTAGGDSLLVTLGGQGALGVVDLLSPLPSLAVIPIAGLDTANGQRPQNVRSTANGRTFIRLTSYVAEGHQLLEVNFADSTTTVRTDAGVSGLLPWAAMAISYDRTVLVVSSTRGAQRYDASSDAFGPLLGLYAGAVSVDASGRYAAIGKRIFDASLAFLRWLEGAETTWQGTVALAPVGDLAYVGAQGGVLRARLEDGLFIDRAVMPGTPTQLRLTSDGNRLVGTQARAGGLTRVMVVDLR